MAALIRAYDWAKTPLGAIETWPQSLKTATGLLVQSPVPLVMLWGPEGVMIYNDAYSAFAGRRHPRLLGSNVREGWPEVADFNDHVMKVVLGGGTLSYKDQKLTLRRHGVPEPVWMNLDYSPVIGEDGEPAGVIAIVVETTERILAERRSAAEQERQRRLLTQMPGFVAVLSGPHHVFDYVNDAYIAISGARDFIGHTIREVFPELKDQGFYELLDQVYATGEPYVARGRPIMLSGETENRFIDFVYEPIRDDTGAVTGIFVGGYDATEAHRAIAALQMSESQFRAMAQAMPNHVWTSSPDGMLDWFNDRVSEYGGVDAATLHGTGWTSFVHPDDLPVAAERWADALAGGHIYETEFRLRRKDGVYRWFIARAAPIRDAAGHITRWVGTDTDIQDQKDLNATLEKRVQERTSQLLETEEALRQAQKMEAVGQLTGGIAHDFNNLLQGITGALDRVQHRLAQGRTADVDRFLKAAVDSANRAAALTHRLLAFSRRQTLDPRPTDVNRLIGGMEDLIRRTMGPQVNVEVVGAAGLWPVRVDASQLENSLLNLCINARDAMPDGGKLTIETANKWMDERAGRERELPPGQYVSLCVTDTGTGMTPDVIARAFDPFFTTKPLGQGTGLGLSMIYGFVRQSGGQVRVYSEVGKGTTMCLYFPRHMGSAEDADDALQADAVEPGLGEVVLVVDDEATVRMLITEVLTEAGYRTIEAADGPAALAILQSDARLDLLITDVGLPGGMNGRQVADAARIVRPRLKVLFITGFAENAAVANGHLEAGMEILAKPFAMSALGSKVREMLEG